MAQRVTGDMTGRSIGTFGMESGRDCTWTARRRLGTESMVATLTLAYLIHVFFFVNVTISNGKVSGFALHLGMVIAERNMVAACHDSVRCTCTCRGGGFACEVWCDVVCHLNHWS